MTYYDNFTFSHDSICFLYRILEYELDMALAKLLDQLRHYEII